MELLTALVLILAQGKNDEPGLKSYEKMMRAIEKRDIFFPAKPKPRKRVKPRRDRKPRKTVRKPPPAPVVTGLMKWPDGWRVLVEYPAKKKSEFHKVGDKIEGAEIVSINTKALVLKKDGKTFELRNGDKIPRAKKAGGKEPASAVGGVDSEEKVTEPAEEKKKSARSERLERIRKKLRNRYKKKSVPEDDDDEQPVKKGKKPERR